MKKVFFLIFLVILLISCSPKPIENGSREKIVVSEKLYRPDLLQIINYSCEPSIEQVLVRSYQFTPSILTICEESTVVWLNGDSGSNYAEIYGQGFSTPSIPYKGTRNYTFYKPGTYSYKAKGLRTVEGKIIVLPKNKITL